MPKVTDKELLQVSDQAQHATALAQNSRQLADSREAARLSALEVQAARVILQDLTTKHEQHEQAAAQLAASGKELLREQYETEIQATNSTWQQAVGDRAHLTQSDADIGKLRNGTQTGLLRTVLITGAAGSGKTSLVQDWLRSINLPGRTAHHLYFEVCQKRSVLEVCSLTARQLQANDPTSDQSLADAQ